MATTPTTTPAPVGEQQISGMQRVMGAFFSPKETFADIARKPTWLLPTILLTITGLGISWALAQRADWVEVTRQQIERVPMAARQMEQLNAEQKARAYEQGAQRAKVQRYVRGAIGSFFLVFVVGLIYWGAFNLAGTGARFKQALAITAFGHLPLAVKEVLGIVITMVKNPSDIDPDNFVASNLTAFLGSDVKLWQYAAAASVDLFSIWCMVLVAIGFSVVNPKKTGFGKALGVAIGVWLFFFIFGVGVAFIFS